MRNVLHERSAVQGALGHEHYVAEQITPDPVTEDLEQVPEQLSLMAIFDAGSDELPFEQSLSDATGEPLSVIGPLAGRYGDCTSLEDKPSPYATGLSHELPWDGPGTLWADLGIQERAPADDNEEAAVMLRMMMDRYGANTFGGGWS